MELLKEAKTVVDFASHYPLLNKATVDNDTPTPGYLYEEIIKLSHHSPGHRQLLVDFLLARLHSSSWPGKQKVIRIFQHLCARGHRGVRVTLRGQDKELRKVAATGGPPDPLLANTPQLFLSSAIQELLTQLFDAKAMKEDEQWLAGKDKIEESGGSQLVVSAGYGSHGVKGKYEGFGSTPNAPTESLVTQVKGIVERVMTTSVDTSKMNLLQGDKGDYQPLSLPSLGSLPPTSQPSLQPHMAVFSASQKSNYKAHRRGRAGGGWDSDEEVQEDLVSPLTSEMELSLGPNSHPPTETQLAGAAEEQFLNILGDLGMTSSPLDHDFLVGLSRECATFDLSLLLVKINSRCSVLASGDSGGTDKQTTVGSHGSHMENSECDGKEDPPTTTHIKTTQLLLLLLLVEFGVHYDVFPPALVHSLLGQTLNNIHENKNLESTVCLKARKLSLIISKFV